MPRTAHDKLNKLLDRALTVLDDARVEQALDVETQLAEALSKLVDDPDALTGLAADYGYGPDVAHGVAFVAAMLADHGIDY